MNITVVAVGTRGDVEPHLALALRLQQRGHRVRVAAPADFGPATTALGLGYHSLGVSFSELLRSEGGTALLASGAHPLRFLTRLRNLAVPCARKIITNVHHACDDADLVCHSPLGLAAYFAARDRGVPCISTSLQPLGRTRMFPVPMFPPTWRIPEVLNRTSFVVMELAFWQCCRPLLREAGIRSMLPAWNCFNEMYRVQHPMLFACSSLLVPRPSDWGPSMHMTGYWRLPNEETTWSPPAELARFLQAGPPPICVGFGSMRTPRVQELLETTLLAIRAERARAIVLTGWSGVQLPRSFSGDDIFVTESVPHRWLFPQAAAAVHHGGAGTTAAACQAGVPSIILPFFFDQAFWGHLLHRHAVGPAPISHRNVSIDAIRSALRRVLADGQGRSRLSQMSSRLNAEDGVGAAAAVIERAGAPCPVPPEAHRAVGRLAVSPRR